MELDNALHHMKVAKLRKAIEKRAGFWQNFTEAIKGTNLGKQMGESLMTAGAAAAITGAGLGAKKGYEALRTRVEKPKAFKEMMGAMPGLKKEDPKAVQMTFNTLYGMNREMARDPLVAGSFVSRHVNRAEVGGEGGAFIDPQTTKMVMEAGSKGRSSGGPIFEAWRKQGSAEPEKLEKFKEQLRKKVRGE